MPKVTSKDDCDAMNTPEDEKWLDKFPEKDPLLPRAGLTALPRYDQLLDSRIEMLAKVGATTLATRS